MSDAVLSPEYAPSATSSHMALALIVSIALHLALAYSAQRLWPMNFSVELKIPAQIIKVALMQPEPPIVTPAPQPIVEPPPTPQPKPKPLPKPEPKPVIKKPETTKPVTQPSPTPKPEPAPTTPAFSPAPIATPIRQDPTPVTPTPIYRPEPAYPMLARRMGQQGTVVLELTLNPSGSVARAQVIESSGFNSLDQSALDTIKTWKFPANRFNGLSSFRQRVEFRLDG